MLRNKGTSVIANWFNEKKGIRIQNLGFTHPSANETQKTKERQPNTNYRERGTIREKIFAFLYLSDIKLTFEEWDITSKTMF